jgi:LysM repeat protein
VQPGDTLEKVLDRFHLTEQELRDLNPMNRRNPSQYFKHLTVKQRLVVYERIEP